MDRWMPYLLVAIAQGVRAFQALIVTIIFARGLTDQKDCGEVLYALTLSQLFLPIFELGSTTILIREFSRDQVNSANWLSGAVHAKIISSLLIIPFAWLTSRLIDESENTPALVVAFSLSYLFRCVEPYENWALAKRDFLVPAVARIISLGAQIAMLVAGLRMGISMWGLAVLHSLTFLVYSAVLLILTRLRCDPPAWKWRVPRAVLRDMMVEASPLFASNIAVVLMVRLDLLMIKPLQGAVAVAIYGAATRISQGLYLIPGIIIDAVYPRLARYMPADVEFRLHWLETLKLQMFAALMMVIVIVPLSPWLVPIIFGNKFAPAIPMLQIHCLSVFFVAIGVTSTRILVAQQRQFYAMIATIVGGVSYVILNLSLIPVWSGIGASIAAVATQVICCCGVYAVIPATRDISSMQWQAFVKLCQAPLRVMFRNV